MNQQDKEEYQEKMGSLEMEFLQYQLEHPEMTKPKTDKSSSEILAEQEIQRLEENEAEITRLKKQMKPKTDKPKHLRLLVIQWEYPVGSSGTTTTMAQYAYFINDKTGEVIKKEVKQNDQTKNR